MAEVARQVRVTGRVQGVFFRAWTKEQASELSVAGWVRNCSDGSVEAHVEGEQAAVERLVGRLRRGPPSSRVETVEVEDTEARGFDDFLVRQ